jgi:ribonuclease-3
MDEEIRHKLIDKINGENNVKFKEYIITIENLFGYSFNDKNKLIRTFAINSILVDENYFEMTEFFGDAILNLVISEYLVDNLPEKTPEKLTRFRSYVTNNISLTQILKKNILEKQLDNFITDLHSKKLADSFESILGSIYIDSGYNKDLIKPIILQITNIDEIFKDKSIFEQNIKDTKSRLNEWVQKTYAGKSTIYYPYFKEGYDHDPYFYVGLEIKDENNNIIFKEENIGPFKRLKDGENEISKIFLKKKLSNLIDEDQL